VYLSANGNPVVIEVLPASPQDLATIRALLESSGLPTSDLESARPEFTVIREDGRVVAAGALQRFGSAALLRSVVVAAERRGGGLGKLMVQELERLARTTEIRQLILLTETAADFFAHQGYRTVERSSAPWDLQASDEFRALCPGTAICMAKSP
jgi:amino-acid N-acetyltransferase